ncbi:uncharacterized protein LOC143231945 [Tachypleus tridentatus]|uniref:uncharacterized protein LOC143231945 n=1 Tax=Tachypleus tridentatus TaxID=6853 RepID=UPI003FD40336
MCDEQETSVPPEISVPKSDFDVNKKSLRKRIWNGLRNVFCCQHDYKPFKQETIRGITDPLDETESWCHDSYPFHSIRNMFTLNTEEFTFKKVHTSSQCRQIT